VLIDLYIGGGKIFRLVLRGWRLRTELRFESGKVAISMSILRSYAVMT